MQKSFLGVYNDKFPTLTQYAATADLVMYRKFIQTELMLFFFRRAEQLFMQVDSVWTVPTLRVEAL